jgi:hypothetical protein
MAPIVPLPTFVVRIVNKTGKPITFDKAKVALVDNTGKSFAGILDASEVQGRNQKGEVVMRCRRAAMMRRKAGA